MSDTTAGKSPSIIIKGNKFFNENTGEQFFVKGIIHAPPASTFNDVLDDPSACKLHAIEMRKQGFNVVHIWAIHVNANHSVCLKAYQDVGLYVLINIHDLKLEESQSKLWNIKKYAELITVIDNLAAFPNILGLLISERVVSSEVASLPNATYANVKASIRDLKLYMKESAYRSIPLGIGTSVTGPNSVETGYLLCGNMTEQKVDFSVHFLPSRCDLQHQSGIDLIKAPVFEKYGIPLLLSDFACDDKSSGYRNFTELKSLYGPGISSVWSGGTIYKWLDDKEKLGLFHIKESVAKIVYSNTNDGGKLEGAFIKVAPSSILMSNYRPSMTASASCSSVNKDWPIHSNLPPSPRNEVCDCMAKALSCVVGPSISIEDVDQQLRISCSENSNACLGVASDQTIGQYGAFSFCDARQRLSWQLSIIHTQSTNSSPCGNEGISQYLRSKKPTLDSKCSTLMALAGSLGEKTVNFEVFAAVTSVSGVIVTSTGRSSAKTTSTSPVESNSSAPVQIRNLASGAIAGIVIGIIAFLAILVGLFLLWRRKERSHSIVPQEEREIGTPPAYIRTELDSKSNKYVKVSTTEASSSEDDPLNRLELAVAADEITETPLSPSWANSEWYDPSDPRQGLVGTPVEGMSGNSLVKEVVARDVKIAVV